jgi:hypothetical protein
VRLTGLGYKGLVLFSAVITFLAPGLARAQSGIAARYPGDKNIGNDPAVILADDFEPYNVPNDLTAKWKVSGVNSGNVKISTGEHYAGAKSIEFDLPISTAEHGYGINKLLSPAHDILYHRAYMKWDAGYNVNSSNHNGICMKGGKNPMTGQAPTGYDFFVLLVQNNDIKGEGPPGWLHNYAYTPIQDQQWGDHWYPNGDGFPWKTTPANFPNFKPLPNFLPLRDHWYCYEMMTRLNTAGSNNGEVKVWVDGKVVADWTDLVIRKVNTLKIDETYIGLHAIKSERLNNKWYDNVVIATQYIGPMASPSPSPSATPTSTPTPTPTSTPTASPTPKPTPTPTPSPVVTPAPSPTSTPRPTSTPTPTATPTPTPIPIVTPPPSPTPIQTPTPTPTPAPTQTPTPIPIVTPPPSPTPTPTPTLTPTATPNTTPTPTATPAVTPEATATPTPKPRKGRGKGHHRPPSPTPTPGMIP